MDTLLATFIRALRNADVRVSTAETLDALQAVEVVGYRDKALLKNTLALVLPKTLDEKATFDTTFDQFFSFRDGGAPPPDREPDAADAEASEAAAADGEGEGQGGGGEGNEPRTRKPPGSQRSRARVSSDDHGVEVAQPELLAPGEMSEARSALGQLLTRGNEIEIGIAINGAGREVNVHEIDVFTQKGVYTRRIMQALGLGDLQREIGALGASAEVTERRLGQHLTRRRDWLRERVRDYVERQFLLHADVTGRRLREDLLSNVRLSAIDQRHHRLIQEIVRRMARRLIAAYSHRRKVFKRGQLHVPRTLRRNMKYDDAIFELHWKQAKVDRPKVFAICDVSGSVANYARFMLMFLYSLDEVLPKVRSFAFSSDLGEVTESFARNDLENALALTLHRYGSGATDYGQAFADFSRLCLDDVDRRTTIIVLGDARNNYGDPRTDALKQIYERCRRLIWLNPEPRSMWNTGDSEMRHFSPYCHHVDECSTLTQLERVVSRLLASVRG
jgi:uncharacterized protein with von Willebrand factor type A (vWA) domain